MKQTLFRTTVVALGILMALAALAVPSNADPTSAGAAASLVDSIILYPVADAWVNYYLPGTNYGGATLLKVGSEECTGQEFPDRGRALLRFDLSAIPTGQVIRGASLQLYLRYADIRGAETNEIMVHHVTSSWTEGGRHLE